MNGACNVKLFFGPAPWCPPEGSKGQISFNFNYKVNFEDFFTNFVCVLTYENNKTYQTGFSFCPLGVPRGSTYFFQTWSCGVSNRRGWRAEQNASTIFILGSNLWPWGEVKGQISLNFGYHVNFKDFYTKFCVCVLTNERYKTYQTEFVFCRLGHAPGVGLWALGVPRGSNIFFSNLVM